MSSTVQPRRRLRVLAVIDTIQVSGPGRQLVASLRELAKAGVDSRVLIFHRIGRSTSPFARFLEENGIDHVVVQESAAFDLRVLRRFKEEVVRYSPDIVQTHGYKPSACMFFVRHTGVKVKWVAFYHGATTENWKVRIYHWLDQKLMRSADFVVLMSRYHRVTTRIPQDRVRIVYNAVLVPDGSTDVHGFRQRDASSPVTLGVVGRLSPEKGVDVFLRACSILKQHSLTFTAVVAGDGPQREELTALAHSLAISDSVQFLGHCLDTDALYAKIDVLVIPSRSEGLPNVLLEGMRFRLPTASTAVGAIPEVLTDTAAGTLCPPDDPGELARAILEASTPAYATNGMSAREMILRKFSLAKRAEALKTLYGELSGHTDSRA